jgi:F-type H+-transporting ATPase subunit epsilon
MKLGIYSLQKVLFQGDAKAVNCNTTSGEITILDHHEPLISVLKKGIITIENPDQADQYIQVASGFLEVDADGQVKMMVEEAK